MIRQTSIDCYNEIKSNGLISKRRLQALEYMLKIAPCTASELQDSMPYHDGGRDAHKRLTELVKLGLIYEKNTRKCKITGKNVIEWDLTDNLPKNVKLNTNAKQQRKDNALDALRELYKNQSDIAAWQNVAKLIQKI